MRWLGNRIPAVSQRGLAAALALRLDLAQLSFEPAAFHGIELALEAVAQFIGVVPQMLAALTPVAAARRPSWPAKARCAKGRPTRPASRRLTKGPTPWSTSWPAPGRFPGNDLAAQLRAAGRAALQDTVIVANIADAAAEPGQHRAVFAAVGSAAGGRQRVAAGGDIGAAAQV
jgi:hypothetical protein